MLQRRLRVGTLLKLRATRAAVMMATTVHGLDEL